MIIWLVVEPYPSEKYEFVSWDDEIPNCFWKVIRFHGSMIDYPMGYSLSNHQPVIYDKPWDHLGSASENWRETLRRRLSECLIAPITSTSFFMEWDN